jgi:hypothetical protein
MTYPFLRQFPEWRIETRAMSEKPDPEQQPTLRWVKDNKVCDLHIPDMNADQFLAYTGLSLSLEHGPFVLSKRISRLIRPFRYFAFFKPNELTIDHSPDLEPTVWDGAGLISSRVVDQIIDTLDQSHPLYELHKREIAHCKRFEITILHDGGQEKGHVILDDSLAVDFLFPADSAKPEVALTDKIFVGLQPVHSDEQMRLDVQSLVNLHPFFRNEHLAAWLHQESELFLNCIRAGEFDILLSRLGRFVGEQDFTQFRSWWLAEYLLSGGSLLWFNGTIQAMGRQHLNRLLSSEKKLRFPIPGGRFYIMPDTVGDRILDPGYAELDPDRATVWVSAAEWNEIAEILGGADGDDGCWVFPFTDYDGQKQLLIWRSPNQLGEYILRKPSPDSHPIQWRTAHDTICWPRMDSRQLPPRIDTVKHQYGELEKFPFPPTKTYTIACMAPAIEQAKKNRGALGAYCNMLLLTKAVYGRLPNQLPARLEDVIDGSVKSFRDLTPVLAWVNAAASAIVRQGKRIPAPLRHRIEPSLPNDDQQTVRFTDNHWIDSLITVAQSHIDMYQANLDALATQAQPPEDVFRAGGAWRKQGAALRHVYATGIHGRTPHPDIVTTCLQMLTTWGENAPFVMLGAAAEAIGDSRLSDAVLWQKETAPLMIAALRKVGLIGEPLWTTKGGAAVYYDEPAATAVPVQINGVWFNWLRSKGQPLTDMSDVPAQTRTWAKEHIASLATAAFDNLKLHMHITDTDRVVAYTEHGNLFGYVQTGHELNAIRASSWQIIQARATDGNVAAVLVPA